MIAISCGSGEEEYRRNAIVFLKRESFCIFPKEFSEF
jgi:hypothetical protein